ncbi:MAG: YidB family protein [Ramlibacter sp.]
MGLLDSVMGAVMGQVQQQGGIGAVLGQLLANDGEGGGLRGLVEKFNEAGLGEVVGSWIGKGENLPVSADQLKEVLGSDMLGKLAGQLGVDPDQASGQLAELLPGLVDKLTPQGVAPENGIGDAGELLGMLGNLLQK